MRAAVLVLGMFVGLGFFAAGLAVALYFILYVRLFSFLAWPGAWIMSRGAGTIVDCGRGLAKLFTTDTATPGLPEARVVSA